MQGLMTQNRVLGGIVYSTYIRHNAGILFVIIRDLGRMLLSLRFNSSRFIAMHGFAST